MATLIDAATIQLESHGLHVTTRNPHTVSIAANLVGSSVGFSVSNDATFLIDQGEKWLAVFPARGQCTFEVPGALQELTKVIISVYEDYFDHGGRLHDAFMRVVPNHQRFLHGAATSATFSEAKSS